MSTENLATYLNDHLAGAVGALELVEHMTKAHAHTPLAQVLTELHREISQDKTVVEDLLRQLDGGESKTRRAAAWLAEKAAEFKLRLDAPGDNAFGRMEAFEALSLGIEGKRSLWLALATVAETTPVLQRLDLSRLTARAVEQRGQVEAERLKAAAEALGAAGAGTAKPGQR